MRPRLLLLASLLALSAVAVRAEDCVHDSLGHCSILGVSSAAPTATSLNFRIDPTSFRLLVDATPSSGTTTDVNAAVTDDVALTRSPLRVDPSTFALKTEPAVTNDGSLTPSPIRIDPATFRLLVDATQTSGTAYRVTPDTGAVFTTTPSALVTYSAATTGILSPAATATDVLCISGGATNVIRVTRLWVTLSATGATTLDTDLTVVKRSTANTGGTSAALTAVPHDSASAAADGSVLVYTANPTLGTAVGNVFHAKTVIPGASASVSVPFPALVIEWDGERTGPIVLRGTAQSACVNLGGFASSADIRMALTVVWTEAAS